MVLGLLLRILLLRISVLLALLILFVLNLLADLINVEGSLEPFSMGDKILNGRIRAIMLIDEVRQRPDKAGPEFFNVNRTARLNS